MKNLDQKKMELYKELKDFYINETQAREQAFSLLWDFFNVKECWIYKDNIRYLSLLEIQADFCMAVHDLIMCDVKDSSFKVLYSRFKNVFYLRVREDVEQSFSLSEGLKRTLKRRRRGAEGKDIPSGGLSDLKITHDIGSIDIFKTMNNLEKVEFKNKLIFLQEFESLEKDVENYVILSLGLKKHGGMSKEEAEKRWYDWRSKFVYDESYDSIAYTRGVSRQAIIERIAKVEKIIDLYRRDFNVR